MSAPVIFNGKFSKLLTQRAVIRSDGGILEYDGPRNYIANSHFEQGVSGWSLLTTTLTSGLPTGSVTLSAASLSALATTSTNPLAGSQSLQVAAGTAWSAGQGIISSAFTVDRKDLGKVLTFKFYYEAVTGTTLINWSGILGSQSLGVYIYDVTASAWVQPAGFLGMNQGTGQGYVTGTFQTSVTAGQQYQIALIALQAPTAGAISLNIDEVSVSPQTAPLGAVMTDWKAYTPTFVGLTASNIEMYSRRVGDSLQIRGQFIAASVNASTASMSLGYNGASGNLTVSSTGINTIGVVGLGITTPANSSAISVLSTAGATVVNFGYYAGGTSTAGSGYAAQPGNVAFQATATVEITAELPISGWSSNVQMSNDTDTRVVQMFVQQGTPSGSLPSNLTYSTMRFTSSPTTDTHACYSTSTGRYTIPINGFYRISGSHCIAGTFNNQFGTNIKVVKNGGGTAVDIVKGSSQWAGTSSTVGMYAAAVTTYLFNAGDTVELQSNTNATSAAYSGDPLINYFSIDRVSGPSVIAASESVSATYTSTTTSFANSTDTAAVFPVKEWDSHGWYSGSVYSVGISGKYHVDASVGITGNASQILLNLYKNGSPVRRLASQAYTTSSAYGSTTVQCVAGDTLAIYVNQTSGGALSGTGSSSINYFSVTRTGN